MTATADPGASRATQEAVRGRTLTRDEYQRYSPRIRRHAMVLARRAPRHVSVADLCAKGFAGLFDALVNANTLPEGVQLDSYVDHRVRAAMLDHLLAADASVREARRISRSVARTIRALGTSLGRSPRSSEIAATLGVDDAGYERLLDQIHRAGIARLDVLSFDDPETFVSAAPALAPDGSDELASAGEGLVRAIEALPEEARQLLMLLYQQDCTMAEAAAVLGRSEPRAVTLFTETMHRLRAALGKE